MSAATVVLQSVSITLQQSSEYSISVAKLLPVTEIFCLVVLTSIETFLAAIRYANNDCTYLYMQCVSPKISKKLSTKSSNLSKDCCTFNG